MVQRGSASSVNGLTLPFEESVATAAIDARRVSKMSIRSLTTDEQTQIGKLLEKHPELHEAFVDSLKNDEQTRKEAESLARTLRQFPGHFSEMQWNAWLFQREVALTAYHNRRLG